MTEVLRYAAFTDHGRGGNPAGVVLDAGALSDAEMLAIAADVGFSETAFVVGSGPEGRRVRYFSPRAEVAFCGHATIATAVALADRDGPGEVTMVTAAGPVVVTSRAALGGTTATLVSVPPRTRPATPDVVAPGARTRSRWRADELDPSYPVHVAFAGVSHLVVPAGSRARLAAPRLRLPGALETLMVERGLDDRPPLLARGRNDVPRPQPVPTRRRRRGPGDRGCRGGVRRLPARRGSRAARRPRSPSSRDTTWVDPADCSSMWRTAQRGGCHGSCHPDSRGLD